MSEVMDIAKSN